MTTATAKMVTQRTAKSRRECVKLQPSYTNETLHLVGGNLGPIEGRDVGIDWHGASRSTITGPTITGYEIGVRHVWAMNATLTGVATSQCQIGFAALSGQAMGWTDAKHHNSASNVMTYLSCVFNSPVDGLIGFMADGSSQQLYQGCVVQGRYCRTGWHIRPRHAGSLTELSHCWLECRDGCTTAIDFDSEDSELIVRGLQFHRTRMPEVVIDMSGAKRCRLSVEHNQWEFVPKVRIHKSCKLLVEVGENQGFTKKQFMDSVEWVP